MSSTFRPTVPLSVKDVALNEALTIDTNGDTALRTTSSGGGAAWSSEQAGQVTSALGATSDTSAASTVVGLLKSIVANLS